MNTTNTKAFIGNSFKDFLLHSRRNKALLWIAGITILLQFIVFKYMYPYAGFFDGGSYVYLETAYLNFNVNIYPIGYPKFLRILSAFTHSDTALVAFQYLLLQCSALYFLFTLYYLYKPGRILAILLFICMVGNPLFLYVSNYVTSDALFISLSLLWLTTLLWILHRLTRQLIVIHTLLLLLVFMVRYSALFYPLIAILAFVLSHQPLRMKLVGIVASLLVIASFMYYTSNQYKELTGIRQFSPFSGWQMANNALYAYRYVQDTQLDSMLPTRFKQLDAMVRTYFDTTRNVYENPQEMFLANSWYMWNLRSPLRLYMQKHFYMDNTLGNLKPWATVAPLYADYGAYLIKQYPMEFVQFYLWPNAVKFYTPPVEFLETYNMGKDSIAPIAQAWFGYKSRKVKTIFKDMKVTILNFYPVTTAILNVLFMLGLVGFIILKGNKQYPAMALSLSLVSSLLLMNMGFSIFAAPIALRFQVFPLLVALSFALMLIEYVFKAAFTEGKKN